MSAEGGRVAADDVLLRAVTDDEAELLASWNATPADDPWGDFPDADPSVIVTGPPTRMVVEAQGEPVGTVSWHHVHYGPNPGSRAWNIGISLIPSARGRGIGVHAQRKLAVLLFATTACNRVEASTDVENLREQRALERAGFTREGVIRGAQLRFGAYHDLVGYAVLRRDLAAGPPAQSASRPACSER